MITTTKKLKGIIIKVVNYNLYQNLKNYEKTNEDSTTTPELNFLYNKNDKNEKIYIRVLEKFNELNQCKLKDTDGKKRQLEARLKKFTEEE